MCYTIASSSREDSSFLIEYGAYPYSPLLGIIITVTTSIYLSVEQILRVLKSCYHVRLVSSSVSTRWADSQSCLPGRHLPGWQTRTALVTLFAPCSDLWLRRCNSVRGNGRIGSIAAGTCRPLAVTRTRIWLVARSFQLVPFIQNSPSLTPVSHPSAPSIHPCQLSIHAIYRYTLCRDAYTSYMLQRLALPFAL